MLKEAYEFAEKLELLEHYGCTIKYYNFQRSEGEYGEHKVQKNTLEKDFKAQWGEWVIDDSNYSKIWILRHSNKTDCLWTPKPTTTQEVEIWFQALKNIIANEKLIQNIEHSPYAKNKPSPSIRPREVQFRFENAGHYLISYTIFLTNQSAEFCYSSNTQRVHLKRYGREENIENEDLIFYREPNITIDQMYSRQEVRNWFWKLRNIRLLSRDMIDE